MSEERDGPREGFIGRWSRVKAEARVAAVAPTSPAPPEAARSDEPAPELPPVDKLTLDSDFSAFLHPKVDEDVRRSALRKLFSDPHFNVMDGLDVYIDDYSVSEPIPAAMLAGLKQAQRILDWAAEDREAVEARERARRDANPHAADSHATDPQQADPPPAAALDPPAEAVPPVVERPGELVRKGPT